MEMKFSKTPLLYMQSIARTVESQEQSQQVRLSESMPDIDIILGSWGQVILRSKEWQTDHIQISGGTVVKILYQAQDKQLVCVDTWLPFQMTVEIPETNQDGNIIARPFLRSVDARTLSDRKISVRTTVGVSVEVTAPCEMQLHTPQEISNDVQILQNTYPVQLPVEVGEKLVHIEQDMDIGVGKTILRQSLDTVLSEHKIIADKLVIRANGILDILYLDENNEICSWNTEIPISQYAQLYDEYDSGATADICFAVTELETEQLENEGPKLKIGLLIQYTVYDRKDISVAEDAYALGHNIDITSQALQIPCVLSVDEHTAHPTIELQLEGHRILDVAAFLEELKPEFEGDVLCVRPSGAFYVLSIDPDGKFSNTSYRWEDLWKLNASPEIEADITAVFEGRPMIQGHKIIAPLCMKLITTMNRSIPVISDIQLGEAITPDPNRPSLILRRLGEDSLWQLAKKVGSTMESIKKANNIQQEPPDDQFLLIPLG